MTIQRMRAKKLVEFKFRNGTIMVGRATGSWRVTEKGEFADLYSRVTLRDPAANLTMHLPFYWLVWPMNELVGYEDKDEYRVAQHTFNLARDN